MKNAPTATLLAKCSELVYARPNESYTAWKSRLADDLESLDIEPLSIVDRGGVQFFVGLHFGHRITCFRGTDSKAEMLGNLFAKQKRTWVSDGAKINWEFLNDAAEAMNRLSSTVDHLDGEYTNWFTGHSRGASIAAIAAAELHAESQARGFDETPVHLVTHGMPRTGNAVFAKYLRDNIPHVRWQRSGDIVPLVPLPPLYQHDCPPQLFDSQDKFQPSAGWWTRLIEWPQSIVEHLTESGIACLSMHEMGQLRQLIETEESMIDSRDPNLLLDLLA